MFEDGREVARFPPSALPNNKSSDSMFTNVLYKEKELIKYFDLDKRHLATRDIGVEKKKAAT